jgi:hypothetical protein
MGAIGTAATGGGALLPWLHLRSEGKWLRWLRLNPPKLAPFLAAPNSAATGDRFTPTKTPTKPAADDLKSATNRH